MEHALRLYVNVPVIMNTLADIGSNGVYEMDDIPPGDYTLRAVARDPRRPSVEKTILRNKIRIYGTTEGTCVVHAVNTGLTVEQNTMTIHFTSTGNPTPTGYRCFLDRSKRYVECKC